MTSIGSLRRQFCSLSPPALGNPVGLYRAEFVGPAWLRGLAPLALALSGLRGWWGKTFDGEGGAANITVRDGVRREVLPMLVTRGPSLLDGRPGVTLRYPASSPFPWVWVVDEVRELDEARLLCMSTTRFRSLSWLALPFLLYRA